MRLDLRVARSGHRLDQGVHGDRRKGSRASSTEWSDEMTEAWEALVARRNAIWNRDGRNFAIPIRPEQRFLLVEQTGNPIARSSVSSAWQRFIHMAMREGVIEESERFYDDRPVRSQRTGREATAQALNSRINWLGIPTMTSTGAPLNDHSARMAKATTALKVELCFIAALCLVIPPFLAVAKSGTMLPTPTFALA